MPDIAAKVFDLVDRIATAVTPDDAWNTYLTAARAVGLEHGLALLEDDDRQLRDRSFAAAMPAGWMESYSGRGCERLDPLAARLHVSDAPFVFHVADWEGCERRRTWHDLNRDAGLACGLIVPQRMGGTLRAVVLCGREVLLHPHDRKTLEFAGQEMLARMSALGAHPPCDPLLSERERECLQWVAAGKGDWEIGTILNLSARTVNVYVERAKRKLQAATRAQAIVFALRRGAINA